MWKLEKSGESGNEDWEEEEECIQILLSKREEGSRYIFKKVKDAGI